MKFSNFSILETVLCITKARIKILVLHLIPMFLGLMCHIKIGKDRKKLSTIGLESYSQSDHVLGENVLQLVVKMSQSYFLSDKKTIKFSWNKLYFPSLPSYFLFHSTCMQSKISNKKSKKVKF